MLGKLMKNEFKATYRMFSFMYIIMLVVTVGLKITMELSDMNGVDNRLLDILTGFFLLTFVLAIIAVMFGTAVLIIKRFYDNMLKDEGYLSFTLPVTIGQHLTSKMLVSYVWVIASVLIIIISTAILPMGHWGVYSDVFESIREGMQAITKLGYWNIVVEVVILVLISVYSKIMVGYTCFSVGQNFNKHRVLGALVTYIGIYMVSQFVNAIGMVCLIGVDLNEELDVMSNVFQPIMIYMLVFTIVQAIVLTVITHIMLSKKLNLE